MKYLLAISIGPVQEFIASARRSRDLWFGSWLLSELSKAAAQEIVNLHKTKASFFLSTDDSRNLADFNAVNKILAPTSMQEKRAGKLTQLTSAMRVRSLSRACVFVKQSAVIGHTDEDT